MRFILWLLRIILFVLLVGFVAKNFEYVTLQYYAGFEYQLPLSILILATFALGFVIGYISFLGNRSRK